MPIRDIALNATEDFPLSTVRIDTGAPTDVAGIVVSAYPDNSATQITAGITVSSPDSIAGYANVRVVATVANGYLANTHYTLVITTGTVNSVSVVGMTVGEFTIRKNVPGLVRTGLAQASAAGTLVLDSGAAFADDILNGHFAYIVAGTGAGQSRCIDDYTGATDTCTISPNWATTPDTTSVFEIYASPPASTGSPVAANATQFAGQTITAAAGVTLPSSVASPTNITAGTITTVTNLTNAPTNGDLTATMKTSVTTAATAATPTVTLADAAITAAKFAAAAIDAAAIAPDAIGSSEFSNAAAAKVFTQAMTEAYAADGAAATPAQVLYFLLAALSEFSVSGTTVTLKKLDGSTSAATLTLGDATNPTSITRAT